MLTLCSGYHGIGYFCILMIRQLSIRNYLLIDHLDLHFDKGLTIITGETGAGKSILLGALGLILGERAGSGTHSDPDSKLLIEGTFAIADYHLQDFITEQELDYDTELIIRREINPQGRSRAFVNDTPVSLTVLRDLGRRLIDIHQQFDQLDVLEDAFQLQMLDALAGQQSARQSYVKAFRQWRLVEENLQRLRTAAEQFAQEQAFLQFQLDELTAANLQPGELTTLETEEKTLRHAEEIRQVLSQANTFLAEDERSAIEQMRQLSRLLHPLESFSPELEKLTRSLENHIIELRDWADEAEALAERTEGDPRRLAEVEQRLNFLNKLLHKHRVNDTDALLAKGQEYTDRLATLAHSDEEINRLEVERAQLEQTVRTQADILTKGREKAAPPFVKNVEKLLAGLGMERVKLQLTLSPSGTLTPSGQDSIQFEMAQQEGSRFASVKQAASGGELSRLTLVIKSLVAAAIPLPTLVFDEIDAGVSGAVSMKVGDILTQMARSHQLIVITHSPQIAARADKHLFVSKGQRNGQIRTQVQEISGEDRIRSLATMLSTDPPTPAALANARELMAAPSSNSGTNAL